MPLGGILPPGDTINAPKIVIPGTDDPNAPQNERHPQIISGSYKIPGQSSGPSPSPSPTPPPPPPSPEPEPEPGAGGSMQGTGGSGGGKQKLVFEPSPKHGQKNRGNISRGPTNGQAALDNSVQVKATSTRRVGVDKQNNEIVVLDETTNGVFHGHVRSWAQLTQEMKTALIKAGLVDRRGRILQ